MNNQQESNTDMKIIDTGFKVLDLIRNSPDPDRATEIVLEVMERISAGEDLNSIKASYGADWNKYIAYDRKC